MASTLDSLRSVGLTNKAVANILAANHTAKEKKMNQISYYDVIVNTARMLDKHRPTKPEVETLAKRMFGYTGKAFDETSFNKAFTEFKKADRKVFRAIYT